MKNIRSIFKGVSGAAVVLGMMASTSANALVLGGDANASAVDLDGVVDISPIPNVAVSGDDSDSQSVIELSVGPESDPFVTTGILNGSASSNVDGSPGPKEATASSSIVDFSFQYPGVGGFSFDTLSSESTVTGDQGSFTPTGNSSIVNLEGEGAFAALTGEVAAGPNSGVVIPDVAEVTLNRQDSACDSFSCYITTDALYVNLLNGLVVLTLGHSHANLTAIPEPTTTALMLAGLAGLGSKRLRRKVQEQVAA
jgi:hypothetical protein